MWPVGSLNLREEMTNYRTAASLSISVNIWGLSDETGSISFFEISNFVLYVSDAGVSIPVSLLMFPCDDKPGFNLCKTLSVYILT